MGGGTRVIGQGDQSIYNQNWLGGKYVPQVGTIIQNAQTSSDDVTSRRYSYYSSGSGDFNYSPVYIGGNNYYYGSSSRDDGRGAIILLGLITMGVSAFFLGKNLAAKENANNALSRINKEIRTLDQNYNGEANVIAKVLKAEKKLFKAIKDDAQFGIVTKVTLLVTAAFATIAAVFGAVEAMAGFALLSFTVGLVMILKAGYDWQSDRIYKLAAHLNDEIVRASQTTPAEAQQLAARKVVQLQQPSTPKPPGGVTLLDRSGRETKAA